MATVNNNWPTPVATDLVKDGWEAIKDLGDAIDTTLGVYTPPATGLTLINTTSFSGVTSVSLPADTFTTTYTNYRLLMRFVGATQAGAFRIRLRTSGTDNSSANYQTNVVAGYNTSISGGRETNATSWSLGSVYTSTKIRNIDLFSPKATANTGALSLIGAEIDGTGLGTEIGTFSFTATTQFDSLTLFSTSANISGTIQAFGYNI